MNILFFLHKFPVYGGVERMTINLVSALNQKGYNIYIISQKGEAEELLSDLSPDIKLLFFPNKTFISTHNINYFLQIVELYKIDYIINQGCYRELNRFLKLVYTKLKKPIISALHNDPLSSIKDIKRNIEANDWKSKIKRTFFPLYKEWVKYLVKKDYNRLCNFSYKIVLLSQTYIKDFKKISQCNDSKICIIPNGIPFKKSPIQYNKEKIVIYVGRVIEHQKRISRLISIWKQIQNAEWKLQIIGDGKDINYYKTQVKQEHISNIEFLGYKKDVSKYMQRASIICLVSDFEGFPMTLIEAMYEKCIPISYGSYSAIYDLIKDGINGYIIQPFDEQSYIKKLKELINSKDLRLKLSNNAYYTSLSYQLDKILPLWEALLTNK